MVAASVFRALHERAGIDARFPVGNAGLLHVYGYLLSTTPTPYGLKRERWLDGELARAYGLAADAFLPWALPTGETLLARVTAAAAALLLYAPVRRQQLGDTEALIAIGAPRHPAIAPSPLHWSMRWSAAARGASSRPFPSPRPRPSSTKWMPPPRACAGTPSPERSAPTPPEEISPREDGCRSGILPA